MKCHHCGNELSEMSLFCTFCDAALPFGNTSRIIYEVLPQKEEEEEEDKKEETKKEDEEK